MIINLMGILTLVAAGLIAAMAFEAAPSLVGDARVIAAAGIVFATSVVAELLGMPARVLFVVPMWMAALALVGVYVYEFYGALGIVGVVVGAVALQALMMLVGAMYERREERREFVRRLREIDLRGLNPAYDQAWDALHEAILIPRVTPWTRELLVHQHRVATLVQAWIGDQIPEPRLLERAVKAFEAGAADPSKVDADKLRAESERLQAVIRNREGLARKAQALRAIQAASR
ncbi:MAG: hypothetical protein R3A79_17565 [Nannocystaceae bacterium]